MTGSRQQGFTLITALFLLVVLAVLAVSLSRVMVSSTISSAQDIQSNRAFYAARSGLDYAVASIVAASACPANPPTIEGFTVTIDSCVVTAVLEGTQNYSVYDVQVTARAGAKSASTLVRRTLRVSVKNP